jgi:hypothetical protein
VGDGDREGNGLGAVDVEGDGVGWTCAAGWAQAARRHADTARAEAFTYRGQYDPKL